MAPKRSRPPRAANKDGQAEIIELSSDSESEAPPVKTQLEQPAEDAAVLETYDQPLLRAAGIKYKTDKQHEGDQTGGTPSSGAKLSVRTKDTGSVKHRHVSIEIPLPTSSMREDGTEVDVWKTPMERRHKTFDFDDIEDDVDVFATPSEGLNPNPLAGSVTADAEAQIDDAEEDGEEDSDDDAPPEDIPTRAAEAETVKAAEAAAKAAEKQAAETKKKRQARDAIFKQQAAQKRALDAQVNAEEPKPEPVEKRKREAPKLLPLELLDSDDEDDVRRSSDSPADDGNIKRRKVISVDPKLLRGPKVKRDQRVGSTVYRVVADRGIGKLAPKAKKQSMNLKETLLRRDRIPHSKTGFFTNKR